MDDILNQAPCGILVFCDDGKIVRINQTLGDWLGYDTNELEGKSIYTILSLASRIFYSTHFFPLVKLHTKADEIFFNLVTKEKKDIPVLTNTVRKQDGNSCVNIAVCIPVYQRKKYEEEILHARRSAEKALTENKALEAMTKNLEARTQELDRQVQTTAAMNQDVVQFSKIVSHDLQEPIRKIKLFANILESSETQDERRRASALQRIQASADRLAQLTMGLQQYVNIDRESNPREIDLNELVSVAMKNATRDRSFDALQIDSDPLPSIEGYPAQLELLFYHLFDNAIQFRNADEDLVINISSTLLEENLYRSIRDKYQFVEHLRIIFKDNGIGFDSQYSDYVFDLVTKAHTGRTGLGIGLALIKKIVDNHGGTVRIESEPGKGTSVFLVLPLRMSRM
jgi:sigma-B regulation protein RsbU (phosphoserine phosphatase)